MTYGTLTYNGVEKKFSDWYFEHNIHGRKVNGAPDEFNATITNVSIAAESTSPTFPFESSIIVRVNRASSTGLVNSFSGGTIKFQGKRISNPAKGGSSGQGVTYKWQGPWYDLANTHYQQTYKGSSGVYLIAETVLNTSTAVPTGLAFISVGDQIQAILQWLLDQYRQQGMAQPFQYVGRALNTTTIAPGQSAIVATGAIDLTSAAGVYNYHVQTGTTISSALYTIFYPSYITKPLMCADALTKCAENLPRMNYWFDHSTTPPTFHATLPGDKTAKTLPLWDALTHESIQIQRRDDLLVRVVNIIYRITGSAGVNYAPDQWGPRGSNSYWNIFYASSGAAADAAVAAGTADPVTGLRVINELIDLQGVSTTGVSGSIDCEPIAAVGGSQATKRAWWASKRGGDMAKLEDFRVRFQNKDGISTTIPDGSMVDAATGAAVSVSDYPYRLVRGTHHSWMTLGNLGVTPVLSRKVKIKAAMTYATFDTIGSSDVDSSGIRHSMQNAEDHHCNMEVTNGPSGLYSTVTSVTAGENYTTGVNGIAKFLFDHLNAYQYDGEAVHVGASFADVGAATYVDLGCALNLSGGATAWLTMNAQIQTIEEDYINHQTIIQIGVARHLNAGQLSSILNMWRNRRPWYNPAMRTDSSVTSGGSLDLPTTAGNADNVAGVRNSGGAAHVDYSTFPNGSVQGAFTGVILNVPVRMTKISLL